MAGYCEPTDLLIGDIPLAGKYGDGEGRVDFAADEIDSMIGHKYVVRVVVDDIPANKPTILLLKKINVLLASGRIILDQAAGTENNNLHSYGKSMLDEGMSLLKMICNGEILLIGAELVPGADAPNDTITVIQEDQYSLVGGFYDRFQSAFPNTFPPMEIGGGS
jgi:hypothetical protein